METAIQHDRRTGSLAADWPARLIEFNLHPAGSAHASWYPLQLAAQLRGADGRIGPRIEAGISRWMLGEFGLDKHFDWEMRETQKRWWLMDGPSLERLTRELSIVMHREVLARVIDRSQLQRMQRQTGEDIWHFAVEQVPDGSFCHRAPTVNFAGGDSEQLENAWKEDGARTLLRLLHPTWWAVRSRAGLRFDRALHVRDDASMDAESCDRAMELICNHLIPRRLPQWAWLL